MNILEAYALSSGKKINKPHTFEKYFAVPFDKYIVIQPFSKGAKNYDLFNDVLFLIKPLLDKENIKIVQVGGQNEPPLNYCYHTQGQTSWGQLEYLISNALLVLSADSISAHLAGGYDIPLVALYSSNYAKNVKPYFGNSQKQIILESHRNGNKPSFAYEEHPKTINLIQPEEIAAAVCKLLNLKWDYPFKTIYTGYAYYNKCVELIPNQVIDVKSFGLDCIIVRMDYLFNEAALAEQLKIANCIIVSDKPINIQLLGALKSNIKEFLYVITPSYDIKFINEIKKFGFPITLVTEVEGPEYRAMKLDFMDIGVINKVEKFSSDIKEFSGEDLNNLYFKTSKFILSNGKIYPSKTHWMHDKNITGFEHTEELVINTPEFWKELKNFRILKKYEHYC